MIQCLEFRVQCMLFMVQELGSNSYSLWSRLQVLGSTLQRSRVQGVGPRVSSLRFTFQGLGSRSSYNVQDLGSRVYSDLRSMVRCLVSRVQVLGLLCRVKCLGLRVQVLGSRLQAPRVYSLGSNVQCVESTIWILGSTDYGLGLGPMVQGLESMVYTPESRVQCLESRVYGLGSMV